MNPTNSELKTCPLCGGRMMFRKALWLSDGCTDAVIHAEPTDCGMVVFDTGTTDESVIAAWNTRKSEALADDAVERVLAHVAGGGPHEWGYRDPVTGDFIADDWPFRAADVLSALRSTPPEADLRAVDLLREAKGYVEDNHDEGCELHWEFGEQNFEANLPDDYDPDKMRIPHCTCGANDLLARIDAALKEAKDAR